MRPGEAAVQRLIRQAGQLRQEIGHLHYLRNKPDVPESLVSAYLGFLTVRLAGFLEEALPLFAEWLIERQSSAHARTFATSFKDQTGNLSSERLKQYVQRFSGELADEMESAVLSEGERRTTLNSLVGVRHAVAHGRDYSASISTFASQCEAVDALLGFLSSRLVEPDLGYGVVGGLGAALHE